MIEAQDSHATQRLFLAVELPRDVINYVTDLQQHLKKADLFKGSYTRVEGMHITLKFLGDVSVVAIPEIDERLKQIHYQPLVVRLGMMSTFNAGHKIRVIYIHAICPAITELVEIIDNTLKPLCNKEKRTFIGHITLARVRKCDDYRRLDDYVRDVVLEPREFTATAFVLKESRLMSEGAEYKVIKEYRFSLSPYI